MSLNGLDSGLTTAFLPHFGLQADLGYVRAADVNGSTHHADSLTFLAGPVFYVSRNRDGLWYVHALLGVSRNTGATPVEQEYITGYLVRPAWAIGTGAQHRLSASFAVRLGFDLLHTSFFNDASRTQGQDNIRATIGFVYLFGAGRKK